MSIRVKFDVSELEEFRDKVINPKVLKSCLNKSGQILENKMKGQTTLSYVKGYSMGETRKAIFSKLSDSSVEVGSPLEYSPYVEKGTRFISAEPIVEPAMNASKPLIINEFKKAYKE